MKACQSTCGSGGGSGSAGGSGSGSPGGGTRPWRSLMKAEKASSIAVAGSSASVTVWMKRSG
jgi:hypothetical protein